MCVCVCVRVCVCMYVCIHSDLIFALDLKSFKFMEMVNGLTDSQLFKFGFFV